MDLAALTHMLVPLSQLVLEQQRIEEIGIGPLLLSPERLPASDARIGIHDQC